MAAQDNPYYIQPANPLQALMAGGQAYDQSRARSKDDDIVAGRKQAAMLIAQGTDPKQIYGALLAAGDIEGAKASSQITQHEAQLKLAQAQLAESSRHNKASEGIAGGELGIKRQAEERAANQPMAVAPGTQLVIPRGPEAGKVVGGNTSSTFSEGAKEITARQIINGDLSGLTNLGKGAQGDQRLVEVRNVAADILVKEHGMTPAQAAQHLSEKLQTFKAGQIEQNAGARVRATREENLNLILKVTEAAIPAALEASAKVARTGWVPINQIIQKGQVIASNPDLKEFGMANLQLAEHWARAMNPTGVMRESDRDMALHFLSTADSPSTYARAVNQLKTQITRERDSIREGKQPAPMPGMPKPAAEGAAAPSAPAGIPPPPPGFVVQ